MEKEKVNVIDQLLDENNDENIILYDKDDNPFEFMQVAVIPLKDDTYAILKPITEIDDVEDDEVLIFKFIENGEDEDHLEVETDEKIINKVMAEFQKLINDKK